MSIPRSYDRNDLITSSTVKEGIAGLKFDFPKKFLLIFLIDRMMIHSNLTNSAYFESICNVLILHLCKLSEMFFATIQVLNLEC
jgi:hypothetical protein